MSKAERKRRKAEIIDRLQETYCVTDLELISGSLIYSGACVLPQEIACSFYMQYGQTPPKEEFDSWGEFIETLLDLLDKK